MTIKRLPVDVASKIAAGEVVERPASVVKELLENALDAGATEITVEVKGGGKRLIRVSDNGSGIAADEVELAFEHHATSKLRVAEDLFALQTLGFRGEALPSIASISQVTILTRTRGEQMGTQLRIEGGRRAAKDNRAAPAGTILSVEHLFYNIPARRKFLRTTATENGRISEIVSTYALAYPERRLSLILNGRQALQTPGNGNLQDAIMAVYGLKIAKQMIPLPRVEDEENQVAVDGYIGGPALHRPNRKYITLFVNGRAVKSPLLTTAIQQAYQGVVPTGRHPVVVLRIEVSPNEIDVNVHPQKQEVKFARSDEVFRAVQRALRRRLIEDSPVHSYTRPTEAIAPPPPDARRQGDDEAMERGDEAARGREDEGGAVPPDHEPEEWYAFDNPGFSRQPPASTRPQFGGQRRDSSFWTEVARQRATLAHPTFPVDEGSPSSQFDEQEGDANQAKGQAKMKMPAAKGAGYQDQRGGSRLPPLRVLGQIRKTFIVCEGPDGLYLIDQHTAHERILLERFQRERARQSVPSQRLLTPLTLELTPQQIALVEEQEDLLLSLGFEIAPFGGLMVQVHALPNLIQHHPDPAAALAEILDGTIADRSGLSWEDRLVMYAACRGAVKAGDLLKLDEMEDLIRQLERTDLSRTCAHGRPTVVRLSDQQLEREFGRR